MDQKIQKELEKAKEYFRELKLLEAYNILRRYYDRLPFKPEREHAEYIGMFARILSELGKKNELNFYLAELERLEGRMNSPEISYQLAMVYVNAEPPQLKVAKELLEKVIRDPTARSYVAKAKMTLAYCYDTLYGDIASCRKLIDSIGPLDNPALKYLLETWKAKVLRDEKKFAEAEVALNQLFKELTLEKEWYSYFIGKLIQIGLYFDWGKPEKVTKLLEEAKALAEGKPLKSVRRQLQAAEDRIAKDEELGPIHFNKNGLVKSIRYANKVQNLDGKSTSDRLLLLLLEDRYVDKTKIVKTLYERQYDSEEDDQLIYYHVHSVRKALKKVGLPSTAIENDGAGYRLIPEVLLSEEL